MQGSRVNEDGIPRGGRSCSAAGQVLGGQYREPPHRDKHTRMVDQNKQTNE